jgi:DNA-binding transcriptional LysR family regulator
MLNETNLSRVDLNLLVLFEAVLAERHVARTAKRLNLSPSAISHGLARLRRLFGDPLFLKHPKGVVPTERALAIAEPVADVLARARAVVGAVKPFDPQTAKRTFKIGAPDAALAVVLPPLLAHIRKSAPHIDIAIRDLPRIAWDQILASLDARELDLALLPTAPPARFAAHVLYKDDFVIAARAGHPYLRKATLANYCAADHLVMSPSGDPHGLVDIVLAKKRLSRRVALTVPNFMLALAIVAESDLLAAMPRSFVARHAARFRVVGSEWPETLGADAMRAIVPEAALKDDGIAWLLAAVQAAAKGSPAPASPGARRVRRSS